MESIEHGCMEGEKGKKSIYSRKKIASCTMYHNSIVYST